MTKTSAIAVELISGNSYLMVAIIATNHMHFSRYFAKGSFYTGL